MPSSSLGTKRKATSKYGCWWCFSVLPHHPLQLQYLHSTEYHFLPVRGQPRVHKLGSSCVWMVPILLVWTMQRQLSALVLSATAESCQSWHNLWDDKWPKKTLATIRRGASMPCPFTSNAQLPLALEFPLHFGMPRPKIFLGGATPQTFVLQLLSRKEASAIHLEA